MTILLKAAESDGDLSYKALRKQIPDKEIRVFPDIGPEEEIEYAFVSSPPHGLLESLPNLKVIFSRWAGVEHLARDPELPSVPVVHMVDRSMTASMSAHVAQQVLNFHNNEAAYRLQQTEQVWRERVVTVPWKRRISVLGLGGLGRDAAGKLAALEFDVAGWSRTPRALPGVACFHGPGELEDVLRRSDMLVCLLPLTRATEGILCARHFNLMPQGAYIINCARGGHVVEDDLLAALDSGQLNGAALDVFAEEPLPAGHPFWRHPGVRITPHVATVSEPGAAVEAVVANIRRLENGEQLVNVVDFDLGY